MDMDDELRRAGDALDDASRRHRQGTWPTGDGRAAWLAMAAALLVVGAVIVGLFAYGRGRDESDAVVVPGTDVAADTTAVITTPESEPTFPRGPVVLDKGYRCLTSQSVDAGGLTFTIERLPACSSAPLVMLRVGGTTSVTCTGPLDAHLSDGTTLTYSYSSKYFDANGAWTPQIDSDSTTVPEDSPFDSVQYMAQPVLVRPIELPATAVGDLVFSIEVQCPDSTPIGTVDIPFTLTPAAPTAPQIVRVDREVQFYGPCGNSSAEFSGETWYPLFQSEVALIDPAKYPRPAPPSSGFRAPKVAPPGPGDDVGTFVVYDNGLARFESQSGMVTWFSRTVHQYNWEC